MNDTVSMVKNANSVECKDDSIVAILKEIREGRWRTETERVRKAYAAQGTVLLPQ